MTVPVVTGVQLSPPGPGKPLLILGHSLGTSCESLWSATASALADDFQVVGWDLPGHGRSAPATDAYLVSDLARAVLTLVDEVQAERGETGQPFAYAGDSVGGAVGLSLLLDHPERISAGTVMCTGAKLGTSESWAERAELVRARGTAVMVEPSAGRWFGPGFLERDPATANGLLHALRDTDRASYAWASKALGAFDVRDRLGEITAPVLAIAGAHDPTAPPETLRLISASVPRGRLVVLDEVGHQAPAEAPDLVAALVRSHSLGGRSLTGGGAIGDGGSGSRQAAGMAVRRAVLGDAWVDGAVERTTDFTREFQDLITDYAWGATWTRPGLDRRSRSLITLTALVAGGHHEELALHVRGALNNGLTVEEIKETLLQTAIYCGVPNANTAFRIAARVLAEIAADQAADPT